MLSHPLTHTKIANEAAIYGLFSFDDTILLWVRLEESFDTEAVLIASRCEGEARDLVCCVGNRQGKIHVSVLLLWYHK